MYIKSVKLLNFGRLTGTVEFSRDRCNIICQQNEFGKTTILDAILYCLYNFPTTGFSRDTLKPKDRYRPWSGSGPAGQFAVELELCDIGERNYRLHADFTRPQPFTLYDGDTLQPIPLDGMTFGQRYLRMALPSFTQAFFLRQDEKEGVGRNQLVSVIEEAAASNRREAPSNVSQALKSLAAPRAHAPGFVEEPILASNLIKRLQEQKTRLEAELDGLTRALDSHRREVEAAADLDAEIAQTESQVSRWEVDLLRVRRQEKSLLLSRYQQSRNALEERQRTLDELQPYAAIDPAVRGDVMALLGDWKMARQRLEEVKNAVAAQVGPELAALQTQLAGYPSSISEITAADIDSLREARTIIQDRQAQLARAQADLTETEERLRAEGVPLDRLTQIESPDAVLSAADREVLFEHTAAHNEAQAALINIEQSALTARDQVLKAKNRRSWFGNIGMGLTGVVVAFMVVGIVLLLTGNKFFGWVSLLAAAAVGTGATLFITAMRAKVSAQELQPAIEAEMALATEARKIQELLDTLESEYDSTLQRLQLTPERVQEMREMQQWRQSVMTWENARQAVVRLQDDLAAAVENVRPTLAALASPAADAEAHSMDAAAIAEAVAAAQEYTSARERAAALEEKSRRLHSESDDLQQDFAAKEQALLALVESDLTRDLLDVEQKAQTFLEGCEKALQLKTLQREYGHVQNMTPEEAADLEGQIARLDEDLAAAASAAGVPTTDLEAAPEGTGSDLEQRISQARQRREEMKERRSRGFREAEKAVNEWRSRGPELEIALAKICSALEDATRLAAACELAHGEMAEIANQVYTQWATALNERVNNVMPLLNDRYREVALSQNLELSVYSQEAGRRLETKDIQHLSKGARDQLLLAVRIAIAEYLSAHVGNLPLAMDEPFAHWDDQRFVEGMRFVTNLTSRHQVILLSCHSWRYEYLKEAAPDLVDKIHFASLQSA